MHVYMNRYVRERFVFSGTFIRWNATMLMTFSKNFSFQKISTTRHRSVYRIIIQCFMLWSKLFLSTTHRPPPKFVEFRISVQDTYS